MTYGTSAYGSSAFGGSAPSTGQIILPFTTYVAGDYEGTVEFTGSTPQYQILASIASEVEVNFEAFSHNDPGETPQSQGTFGGIGLSHEAIIGAARFIIVQANVPSTASQLRVIGRPYTS